MSFLFSNPISPQARVQSPPFIAVTPPPSSMANNQFQIGDMWVDKTSEVIYILANIVNGAPVWVNTVPASSGSFTSLTVTPGPTSITGEFHVDGNIDEANVILLEENGGTAGTITIESLQGTGTSSINVHSVSGGINIQTDALGKNINLSATDGSVGLAGGENAAQAIFISAGGGTSATMQMVNLSGTNDASTIANSSILISSTSGGVGINCGKDFNLATSTGVTITAGSDVDFDVTGAISLDSTLSSNFSVTGAAADLTLQSAGGSVNILASEAISDAIVINASAGAFEIDGVLASHMTVTGAAADLTVSSVGGSVNVTASEAISDAIVIDATGASAGIQIAPSATVASIAIGNITPTVSRTTTINGAVVNAAHTDLVSIADGGVSTSASAEKEVTIATGATAVGLTLVSIATGNVSAAGNTTLNLATGNAPAGTTQAISLGTGTGGGTKSISMGNADGLTSISELGIMSINTSGTATTTIGSTSGGAVILASLGVITVNSADTTGSDILIEATGAGGGIKIAPTSTTNNVGIGNVVPTVARTITVSGGTVATAVTDTLNLGTGGVSTSGSATKIVNIASDLISTGVCTVNIATGTATTGTKTVNIANADGLTPVVVNGGNVNIKNNQVAGAAGPSATVAVTNQARVGSVTLASYTQAAAATLTITLTNASIAVGSMIFASMTDVSSNSTLMTLEKINPGAGSAVFVFVNNGSQAVNGNLQFNYWVLS